jgi:uncharacterized protein (TIGR03067 family)
MIEHERGDMMRRATHWAGLAAVLVLATLAVRADDKVSGDLKKLQGTWVSAGGDGPDSTWKFEGQTLKTTVNGQDYTCTVKLDEKAKPHATIDLAVKDGPDDSSGKTAKAIYKFDGAKLFLCVTRPGNGSRPTEFKTTEDQIYLFELKKE